MRSIPEPNRREFLATGLAGAVGAGRSLSASGAAAPTSGRQSPSAFRALFPRLRNETFLNAAGGTPLGRFAEDGLARFVEFWRLGPDNGRAEYFSDMLREIRGRFGRLIGAEADEIALVPNTKTGEQIALDSLPALREGGNVVTNDLHFAGSLHNLEGLRRAGLDVRVVRHTDWQVPAEAMAAAMDDRTALVCVALVSNVNGHVEPIEALARAAHDRGALVYADIIQAAGILPIDVRQMGIDLAACNGYKWLFGPHGAGFMYVAREHQGTTLSDRLIPGHAQLNYRPWVETPATGGPVLISPPADARRYEPGHHAYAGYCAVYEGLTFIETIGVAEAQAHAVRLGRRLVERVDPARYPCLSPHLDRSPIVTFRVANAPGLEDPLRAAGVVVSLSASQMRVSPAIYNTDEDVDRLAEVLNGA